ncbi:MAG: GTP 3',8-cyclase MoaA [Verrucomicrobiales bacterium]|nr:GTP 3',8-cyclase MoaA [Verrucomicrobiales bacterium]
MEDRFGHRISYLRISVTDRCNERCRYCIPEEVQQWLPRDGILTYEEILRIVRVGTALGIRKVRVTGGEPLTRRGVLGFVRELRSLPGIEEVGVSTNGTLLADPDPETNCGRTTAEALAAAGVRSVNISLDSLDRAEYAATAGRDFLPRVLAGIDAALAAGIPKVKLNAVLMHGRSAETLPELIEFAAANHCVLRFIELMPVSSREMLTEGNFLSAGAAQKSIEARYGPLLPRTDVKGNGPAVYYQIPGREQVIGFIGAMTNLHFCDACNKLRLTADGRLRPCLGSYLEFDLLKVLRAGASDEELRQFFLDVVARKPKEHDFRNNYEPNRTMIAIGG